MEVYMFCYISTIILYVLKTVKINKIRNVLEEANVISKQQFLKEILRNSLGETVCKYTKGKYYAYSPLYKTIIYIDKEKYSLYDVFGLCHEIGHCIDDLQGNRVLKNMILTAVNRVLFVPLVFLSTCLATVRGELFDSFRRLFLDLNVLCFLHRICYICVYEISASKYALKQLNCKCTEYEMKYLKELGKVTMQSQIMFSTFGIMTIIFIQIMYHMLCC